MFERSGCYPNFPAVISKIRHFEDKEFDDLFSRTT